MVMVINSNHVSLCQINYSTTSTVLPCCLYQALNLCKSSDIIDLELKHCISWCVRILVCCFSDSFLMVFLKQPLFTFREH